MRKKFPHCCLNSNWFLREYTLTLYNSVWPSVLASTMDFGSSSLKTNHRSPTIRFIKIPSNSLWRLHSDFLCFGRPQYMHVLKAWSQFVLDNLPATKSMFTLRRHPSYSREVLQQREWFVPWWNYWLKSEARMFDVVCIMEYCSHL